MRQEVMHLFNRAGFGLSPEGYGRWKNSTRTAAIAYLFEQAKKMDYLPSFGASIREMLAEIKEMNNEEKKELLKEGAILKMELNAAWVRQMAATENVLREKMTLFWHGHFACEPKVEPTAHAYINTIRQHALGNFRELTKAVARQPAMLNYLNNQQNKKKSPNENFTRELMELFTIGRGNYTEQDVKEGARAFTGWMSNLNGEFYFNERQHDFEAKTFMGKTGNFDGDDIIDILLERSETATFLARKVFRYFVNDQENTAQVNELAEVFRKSNYDIETMMRHLFSADWFYSSAHRGTMIKSPLELIVNLMKVFHLEIPDAKAFMFLERALGQEIFNPPNVAGWPGGRAWIDNARLLLRLNLPGLIYEKSDFNVRVKDEFEVKERSKALKKLDAQIDFAPLVKAFETDDFEQCYQALTAYLYPTASRPPIQIFEKIEALADSKQRTALLAVALMSAPEYQLH